MRLGNSGKSLLKLAFFKKRIKFELIRNIRHQMKSLRESFITSERANEAFHKPGYAIRLQKERQIHANNEKFARKRCPPYQFNIKLIIKNNKNLCLHFLQATTFVSQMTPIIVILWKKTKTYIKEGKFAKITKIVFQKINGVNCI